MQNDDSFNDSDEIFNLYSSKNIKETFKTQFQKLVAKKPVLPNGVNKNISQEPGKENEESQTKSSSETTMPTAILNGISADDSVEILEHIKFDKSIRRSLRLRKKRQASDSLVSVLEGSSSAAKKPSRRRNNRQNVRSRGKPAEEVIVLDSPGSAPNIEEDELNPEISVKLIWKSVSIKKFQIRKFQKFAKVFEELSKEENIPEEKIILTFNNVRISRNDTPDSLNLQLYHFIDGGVLSESTNSNLLNPVEESLDENLIAIKFQDINKKVVKISLNKNDKIKVAMIKYSEQLEVPMESLKFYFDGELINPLESPASLDLENNEIIDVKICD